MKTEWWIIIFFFFLTIGTTIFMIILGFSYGSRSFDYNCLEQIGQKVCEENNLKFNNIFYAGTIGESPFISCFSQENFRETGVEKSFKIRYLYDNETRGCKKRT